MRETWLALLVQVTCRQKTQTNIKTLQSLIKTGGHRPGFTLKNTCAGNPTPASKLFSEFKYLQLAKL